MSPTTSAASVAELNTRVIQHATTLLTQALESGVSGATQVQVALAHQLLDALDTIHCVHHADYLRPLFNRAWSTQRIPIVDPENPHNLADALLTDTIKHVGQILVKVLQDGVAVHTPELRLSYAFRTLENSIGQQKPMLKRIAELHTRQNNEAPL